MSYPTRANTLLGMNKAGGGTNVPKMANNIQMATGGGMVGSTLDPTKTAASMPGPLSHSEVPAGFSTDPRSSRLSDLNRLGHPRELAHFSKAFP